jgi:hypothetical protein
MGPMQEATPPSRGALSSVSPTLATNPGSPGVVPPLEWRIPAPREAASRADLRPTRQDGQDNPRCSEKGCIFPAHPGNSKCLHHSRQEHEPTLYQSHQPTLLVVERGKFEVEGDEPDFSRDRDRRRLALEREAFLEE